MTQEDKGELGVVEKRLPGVPKYYYWGKNPKNILAYYRDQAKSAAEAYSKVNPAFLQTTLSAGSTGLCSR
jgi:hypothetical protein